MLDKARREEVNKYFCDTFLAGWVSWPPKYTLAEAEGEPFDDRYLRCQNGCSPGKYLHHLVRISGGDRLHVPFLGLVDAAMRPKDERSIRGAS